MTWQQGSDAIELLLGRGELERVAPAPDYAGIILDEARRHLKSAAVILEADPSGGMDWPTMRRARRWWRTCKHRA